MNYGPALSTLHRRLVMPTSSRAPNVTERALQPPLLGRIPDFQQLMNQLTGTPAMQVPPPNFTSGAAPALPHVQPPPVGSGIQMGFQGSPEIFMGNLLRLLSGGR